MSRLADHIEAYQLGMASQLLEHPHQVLDDDTEELEELHLLTTQLTCALRDVPQRSDQPRKEAGCAWAPLRRLSGSRV
jgi:hypothetical protein